MQWVFMAALTAAAAVSVLLPLVRRRAPGPAGSPGMIYRDQLRALDEEAARGVVPAAEAEAARTEIARRLIRAEEAAAPDGPAGSGPTRAAALLTILALPVAALTLYLALGSPGLPDMPLTARLTGPPRPDDVAALIGRVEQHLVAEPDDGQGWELIAPIYTRLGRLADAAKAYGNAARLLPPSAERQASLGESLVRLSGGKATPEAMAAFDAAIAIDARNVRARFYRAMGLGQLGRTAEAVDAWTALLKDAPPAGTPWADAAKAELARLTSAPATGRGPSEADVAAAQEMTPAERQAMISSMVAGLAERLEKEPADADGWQRLIRSYVVLGRADDARAALGKAKTALAGDEAKLAALDGLAKSLKLVE